MNPTGGTMVRHSMPLAKSRRPNRQEPSDVVIGKDILELVSTAMYVDPMTVYREYIQNSADAVDAARATGLLSVAAPGRVDISTDVGTRTVIIRDNGCGLPAKIFGRTLTALGGSAKRGSLARGFRGVGRLAGLAYAQELVFRSRAAGEDKISELRWDCRQLKAVLRDASADMEVADLIHGVTTLACVKINDPPEHFFEVEMRGVIRLQNDRLFSPLAIAEYLSQVAPAPFSPEFRFGPQLTQALSEHVDLGELEIRINGSEEPIYRPHRNSMGLTETSILNFDQLDLFEIPSIDDNIAAVAWVLHHDYEGALQKGTLVKGLRVRTGNIQVGGHRILEELFPEPRFNSWSVGEVHVFDRRIIPNGRRDQFEANVHYYNLLNHLSPAARDIAQRCRTSSAKRKQAIDFEFCAQATAESIQIIIQGSASRKIRDQLALSAEQSLLRMAEIAKKDIFAEEVQVLDRRIDDLRGLLSRALNDEELISTPLMRLPEEQRRTYQHFFDLIYECSTNRMAAKALVDRILLKLE